MQLLRKKMSIFIEVIYCDALILMVCCSLCPQTGYPEARPYRVRVCGVLVPHARAEHGRAEAVQTERHGFLWDCPECVGAERRPGAVLETGQNQRVREQGSEPSRESVERPRERRPGMEF